MDKFQRNLFFLGSGFLALLGSLGMKWISGQKEAERNEKIIRDETRRFLKEQEKKNNKGDL